MAHRTRVFWSAYGFYIAMHPWLRGSGYVKVGCTADLSRRLEMASFTTCFTPEWSYFAVFECESIKEAFLLEQAVLFLFKERRVPQRELIKGDAGEVVKGAQRVCDALNLNVMVNVEPMYTETGKDAMHEKQLLSSSLSSSLVPSSSSLTKENSSRSDGVVKPSTLGRYLETLEKLRKSMHVSNLIDSSHTLMGDCKGTIVKEKGKGGGEEDDDDNEEEEEQIRYDLDIPDLLNSETFGLSEIRPYQEEAVVRCLHELENRGATICQMACRCGKTPVAYKLIQYYLNKKPSTCILYLVPGLTLLRQTVRKLYSYGLKNVKYLLIGSYTGTISLEDNLVLTMTTNAEEILHTIKNSSLQVVVISTYQSSFIVSSITNFSLTVFDECHRVCGSTSITNFNSVLLQPRSGNRLFLTATPAYDTPIKMDNTHLFGGIAFRYYLREGIDAGYVNSFSLRIILGESMEDLNPYFFEAMRLVNKMIVYCRSIAHAMQLMERLQQPHPSDITPFKVFIAHSRMGSVAVANILRKFSETKRCLLLNVRLFQEGIEIPDLNAVFFAAPRYSSRDIVQSICRPLNKLENKPGSYVFLPATIDKNLPENHPVNLQKFSTLIPFTDALMDEDPILYEYLIDPHKVSYDIDIVGVRSLKLSSERLRKFVLPAIRRGVRYSNKNSDRLHRAARIPWKPAFNELRRIVLECNRYPKNNDAWVIGRKSISMALFYRYVRKGYYQYLKGEPSYLRIYQIRDLESLPLWRTYGMQGPYPWEECLSTLQTYLEEHGRVPPLDVHKGGYIGLDATPFERLSGALMHINQCDAHDKMRLDPVKQKDLDELCKRYKIKWRKERDPQGCVIPGEVTFITESYESFKKLYESRHGNRFQEYINLHFPGYPTKHDRMEDPRNLANGRVPPRHVSRDELKEPQTLGKVMCRVCRRHIAVRAWERHLQSKSHLTRLVKSSE
ncbi:helicase-like protein [Trypanosoma theileri]|uniref:Probable helicase A859L n=1 Tax=Trypanosoma theileri TaxID=67003 RepID=A0A1X0P8K5_9TRYP|nr:helicase-like protein [Trypanosoma theileri]ORC92770.1 helicase-like protein [Trypanosoma theileri]